MFIKLNCDDLKRILNWWNVTLFYRSSSSNGISIVIEVEELELKMFRDFILINNSK
jgi:hypothetical protein